MKNLFEDYSDSLLISTRKAIKDSLSRPKWLPMMKPFYLQRLKQIEAVMSDRKDLITSK